MAGADSRPAKRKLSASDAERAKRKATTHIIEPDVANAAAIKPKGAKRALRASVDTAARPLGHEDARLRLLTAIEQILGTDGADALKPMVECRDLPTLCASLSARCANSLVARLEAQLPHFGLEYLALRSDCRHCSAASYLSTFCHKCFRTDVTPRPVPVDWQQLRANTLRVQLAEDKQKLAKAAKEQAKKAKAQAKSRDLDEEAEEDQLSQQSHSSQDDSPRSSAAVRVSSQSRTAMTNAELLELRERCVLRALAWSKNFTQRAKAVHFESHGGDMAFLYRFVIDLTHHRPEINAAARATVQCMLDKWERTENSMIDSHAEAEHVLEFTEALHAKIGWHLLDSTATTSQLASREREIVRHRGKLFTAVARHSIHDLARFNASHRGSLPVTQPGYCLPCGQFQSVGRTQCPTCDSQLQHPRDLEALCESVVWLGVFRDIGFRTLVTADTESELGHALHFIQQCRPYLSRAELGADQFRFQCYLLTHLCFILSTSDQSKAWYEHTLDRALLAEEFLFLNHAMDDCLALQDPELVGELLCALRVFGLADTEPSMVRGYAFLLSTELVGAHSGCWLGPKFSFYKRYHAAYCGIIGLAPFQCRDRADLESVRHFFQ